MLSVLQKKEMDEITGTIPPPNTSFLCPQLLQERASDRIRPPYSECIRVTNVRVRAQIVIYHRLMDITGQRCGNNLQT